MRIISLEAENVKRLKAVHIEPSGDVVVIGGENGQGKTTTLDCIMYALGGKSMIPGEPVSHDAERATIKLDIGEFVITRKMNKDGSGSLLVKRADGSKGNQTSLNELLGAISLDPAAFARMDAKKQAEVLRGLLGLDFSELDEKRKGIFDTRTDVNREAKRIKAHVDSLPALHEDAPSEEVSVSALAGELRDIESNNRDLENAHESLKFAQQRAETLDEELKNLQGRIEDNKRSIACMEDEVSKRQRIDVAPTQAKLDSAEETNRQVRENAERKKQEAALKEQETRASQLTAQLEAIDNTKAQQLAAAKMPVEGLTIDDGEVRYNGSLFSECSGAEKLRVSVAMAAAMNPKLRVFLVRDGSLMDAKSMALLADLAKEYDAQVWVERVGDGDEGAIIIEDGEVREPANA
jgi:DNA repair exonuclease SbcCD ATPase subunit